jgi:TPR repeat protein
MNDDHLPASFRARAMELGLAASFLEAAEHEDTETLKWLAFHFAKKEVWFPPIAWYCKLAEQGDPQAQHALAVCYYFGDGIQMNRIQARVWCRKAAEQGHPVAQNFLGELYATGAGGKKEPVEALVWYRKAVEQGNAAAQNNLGGWYFEGGNGLLRDMEAAFALFSKSAEQGDADGQCNLGRFYDPVVNYLYRIEVVKPDEDTALAWYRKAAKQGHASAETTLLQRGSTMTKIRNLAALYLLGFARRLAK